jgi:hypothetical protein
MRHDWIFDVLIDLRLYAQSNGLPALALKAEEALRIARAEIAGVTASELGQDPDEGIGPSPAGLPH